jgi:hypothetical protein
MGEPDPQWKQQRARAIASHAAELARRESAEADEAQEMLRAFAASMSSRGIAPLALRARSYDGRHRYRTGLRGWYLRVDESLAVDEQGQFYILLVRGSLRALVSGTTIAPTRPRLVIGEGGRDGERIALRALLDRILG